MTYEEYFQQGNLSAALASLQEAIRRKPADPALRVFLFQLYSLQGSWSRAHTQLGVLKDMTADTQLLAAVFKPLLDCEKFRSEVFAGRRTPLLFGEPASYLASLVQALQLDAQGDFARAAEIREEALEQAPARSGAVNEKPFSWLMDADRRLGPVLEVVIERRYYWLPLEHIRSMESEAPHDIRDLIWQPMQLELINGGKVSAFHFARYPNTEQGNDDRLLMSRMTTWQANPAGLETGLGQRLFATEETDLPALEIRSLRFNDA